MELRPAPELPQARRGPLHPSIKRPLRLWNAILNCHARGPRGTPALGRDFRGWSGSGVIVAEAMGGDAGAAFRPGQVRQLICAASSRVTCRRNIGFTAECYSDCRWAPPIIGPPKRTRKKPRSLVVPPVASGASSISMPSTRPFTAPAVCRTFAAFREGRAGGVTIGAAKD